LLILLNLKTASLFGEMEKDLIGNLFFHSIFQTYNNKKGVLYE